jgi:hypothetical protein
MAYFQVLALIGLLLLVVGLMVSLASGMSTDSCKSQQLGENCDAMLKLSRAIFFAYLLVNAAFFALFIWIFRTMKKVYNLLIVDQRYTIASGTV